MTNGDFLYVFVGDFLKKIQLLSDLSPAVVVEDNKVIYRVINAIQ
jgi:hypothetical protein